MLDQAFAQQIETETAALRVHALGASAEVLADLRERIPVTFPDIANELLGAMEAKVRAYAALHPNHVITALATSEPADNANANPFEQFTDGIFESVSGFETNDEKSQLDVLVNKLKYLQSLLQRVAMTDTMGGHTAAMQGALMQGNRQAMQLRAIAAKMNGLQESIKAAIKDGKTVDPVAVREQIAQLTKELKTQHDSAKTPPNVRAVISDIMTQLQNIPQQLTALQKNTPIATTPVRLVASNPGQKADAKATPGDKPALRMIDGKVDAKETVKLGVTKEGIKVGAVPLSKDAKATPLSPTAKAVMAIMEKMKTLQENAAKAKAAGTPLDPAKVKAQVSQLLKGLEQLSKNAPAAMRGTIAAITTQLTKLQGSPLLAGTQKISAAAVSTALNAIAARVMDLPKALPPAMAMAVRQAMETRQEAKVAEAARVDPKAADPKVVDLKAADPKAAAPAGDKIDAKATVTPRGVAQVAQQADAKTGVTQVAPRQAIDLSKGQQVAPLRMTQDGRPLHSISAVPSAARPTGGDTVVITRSISTITPSELRVSGVNHTVTTAPTSTATGASLGGSAAGPGGNNGATSFQSSAGQGPTGQGPTGGPTSQQGDGAGKGPTGVLPTVTATEADTKVVDRTVTTVSEKEAPRGNDGGGQPDTQVTQPGTPESPTRVEDKGPAQPTVQQAAGEQKSEPPLVNAERLQEIKQEVSDINKKIARLEKGPQTEETKTAIKELEGKKTEIVERLSPEQRQEVDPEKKPDKPKEFKKAAKGCCEDGDCGTCPTANPAETPDARGRAEATADKPKDPIEALRTKHSEPPPTLPTTTYTSMHEVNTALAKFDSTTLTTVNNNFGELEKLSQTNKVSVANVLARVAALEASATPTNTDASRPATTPAKGPTPQLVPGSKAA